MWLAHRDEPVAAVERRAEHDVGALTQRAEGSGNRPWRQARNVRRDDRHGPVADVACHAEPQRVGKPATALRDEACVGCEPGKRGSIVARGVQDPDVVDLGPAGSERVEQQGFVQRRGLLR